MKKLFFITALLIAGTANAQITFQKTFGESNTSEAGLTVQQLNDGRYLVIGGRWNYNDAAKRDFYLMVLNQNGDTLLP